jgi:hypothetical protein
MLELTNERNTVTYDYGKLLELVRELYPDTADDYAKAGSFLSSVIYVLADEQLIQRVGDALSERIKEKETN